jgi:hypothetical protein
MRSIVAIAMVAFATVNTSSRRKDRAVASANDRQGRAHRAAADVRRTIVRMSSSGLGA